MLKYQHHPKLHFKTLIWQLPFHLLIFSFLNGVWHLALQSHHLVEETNFFQTSQCNIEGLMLVYLIAKMKMFIFLILLCGWMDISSKPEQFSVFVMKCFCRQYYLLCNCRGDGNGVEDKLIIKMVLNLFVYRTIFKQSRL